MAADAKPVSFIKQSDRPFNRPGVSDATLIANGICHVASGIEIPYRTISDKPVLRECDGGRPYCRTRLRTPRADGQKYAQPAGSKPYGYNPDGLHALHPENGLVVVEGEFKALSLAEAGIAAVGIGGITCGFQDGQLVPGLREVVANCGPAKVWFLGDADTSLIYAFSVEAVKFAKALAPTPVFLPRIGLDGPGKGIDDCREALGEEFPAYWAKLVESAEPVDPKDRPEDVALRLFNRESDQALTAALR